MISDLQHGNRKKNHLHRAQYGQHRQDRRLAKVLDATLLQKPGNSTTPRHLPSVKVTAWLLDRAQSELTKSVQIVLAEGYGDVSH